MSYEVLFDKDAEETWGDNPQTIGEGNPPEEIGGRKAVGVLVVKDGKYLVGTRISNTGYGQICGPGGHVEPGENPAYAAMRETDEEFGIIPNDLYFIDCKEPDSETGLESYMFLCTDFEGEPKCDDEEMTGAHWLSDKEVALLEDTAFPAFLNGIERVKKSLEHPEEEPDEEYPNVRDKDEGKPMVSAFRGGIETRI